MGANRTARYWLAAIIVLYLVLAALFAACTPPGRRPTSPRTITTCAMWRSIYRCRCCMKATIPTRTWSRSRPRASPRTCRSTRSATNSTSRRCTMSLAAPVYTLTGGNLTALRLLSVLLGAGIVLLAYAIGRRVFPLRPALGLGAAALVAFLPQHLATVSQVGNDVLAELLFAAALYVLIGWLAAASDGKARARVPVAAGPAARADPRHQDHRVHRAAAGHGRADLALAAGARERRAHRPRDHRGCAAGRC